LKMETPKPAMNNTIRKLPVLSALFLLTLLTACGDNTTQPVLSTAVEKVSNDASIQAAYAGCTRTMAQGLVDDNPGLEQDILNMMLQPVPEMCLGYVVKPCEKDRDGFLCKTMLDEYSGT